METTENPPQQSGDTSPKSKSSSDLSSAEAELILVRSAREAQANAERREIQPGLQAPPTLAAKLHSMAADNRVRDLAQADEDRQHRERVARLVASNGVPKRYQGASLMDVDAVPLPTQPQYLEACHALSALFERPMMVAMLGGRGAGKTHMACGLVNDFCRAGRFALYVVAMDYFIALQETYGDGAKEKASAIEAKYLKPELLVLDAMEERANTEWNGRMLTHLINKRYAAELATVLISNEQQPQFVQRVGESIADRIRDEGGMIECTWKSLRGRLLKEEAA